MEAGIDVRPRRGTLPTTLDIGRLEAPLACMTRAQRGQIAQVLDQAEAVSRKRHTSPCLLGPPDDRLNQYSKALNYELCPLSSRRAALLHGRGRATASADIRHGGRPGAGDFAFRRHA